MSFLHMSLLAGLAVITVPIMLHLFGQRQPQLIDFPALRFVRETTQEQSTSWQLRHFLLLLLRILLLAALALALARPRVHSAALGSVLGISALSGCALLASLIAAVAFVSKRPTSIAMTILVVALALWAAAGLWGYQSLTHGPAVPTADQSAPVATALIIDNGPTMAYRADNEVRLEAAKNIALWILDQLPLDSRVGVLTGAPIASLALDPSTAESQVKLIEARGAHVDLLTRVRTALDLVLASELERKEIYVITDLMSASWASAQSGLQEMLKEYRGEVLLQVVDVGTQDAANWQIGDPKPDFETVPAGSNVAIEFDVRRPAAAQASAPVTVELTLEELNPNLPVIRNGELQTAPSKVVARENVDLSRDSSKRVRFEVQNLAPGTHHLTLRLDKADPLPLDNERYLSIVSQNQRPTLVVANNPDLGRVLKLVVDASAESNQRSGERLAEQVRYTQLGQAELEKFAVICLFDPPPLSIADAQRLKQHVASGGGLLILLGPGLGSLADIRGNPLLELLPGKLGEIHRRDRSERNVTLSPVAISHPLFHTFGIQADEVPWNYFPIFSSWSIAPLADNAQILMQLSDGSGPVVISQNLGSGQIITFCTPIPEPETRDRPLWNELWAAEDPWAAFGLLSGAIRTLSGAEQESTNYQVGVPASLRNDTQVWPTRYELFLPNAQMRRIESSEGSLLIGSLETAGIYRLRGVRGDPVARGFSVNVAASDTQLERVEKAQLDELLGVGNYRVARDQGQIESSVGQARFGRELYPLMMIFVAGLFLAEQAMSNRFYKIKFSRARAA